MNVAHSGDQIRNHETSRAIVALKDSQLRELAESLLAAMHERDGIDLQKDRVWWRRIFTSRK
jgi:hypothetical protein